MVQIKRIALKCLVALRANAYGRDSWYYFEEGRTIARTYFGDRATLVTQMLEIESVSKRGLAKSVTGNTKPGVKQKRAKTKRAKKLDAESRRYIEENLPPLNKSERGAFFKSVDYEKIRDHLLPKYHEGQILWQIQSICKQWRKNKKGVYFAQNIYDPSKYKIGYTRRSPEERQRDTGSWGRYWKMVAQSKKIPEKEVHRLLRKWRDDNGQGIEIYNLDIDAQELISNRYKIWLPIKEAAQ